MALLYQEYRCSACKKLLFKGFLVESEIEIKCRSCHTLSTITSSARDEYLCMIKHCPNRIQFAKDTSRN